MDEDKLGSINKDDQDETKEGNKKDDKNGPPKELDDELRKETDRDLDYANSNLLRKLLTVFTFQLVFSFSIVIEVGKEEVNLIPTVEQSFC